MFKFLAILMMCLSMLFAGCGDDKKAAEAPKQQPKQGQKQVQQQNVPHRKGMVGISNKDIKDVQISFSDKVRNDVTGNWRLATTGASGNFTNYAKSYYDKYFKDDKEVHVVVIFGNDQTAIMNVAGNQMFLSYYKHVKGEEHDAKAIPSGKEQGEFIVYLDNGDIDKIK